jgi:CheY-like chemotaxis protein
MTPAEQERAFRLFEQVGAGRRSGQGTGLGLALCRRLVDVMEGRLEIQSEPGQGSTFTLEVPVALTTPEEDAQLSHVRKSSRRYARLLLEDEGQRILVVDDVEENRVVVRQALERSGFEVREAESGSDCLATVERWRPDAVLLDIRMPGMDGYEVTRRLRANEEFAKLPIIALTAGAFSEDRERAEAAGVDGWLPKPVILPDLLALLRKRLEVRYREAPRTPLEPHTRLERLDTDEVTRRLRALAPNPLLERLHAAAVELDQEALEALIEELSAADAALSGTLRALNAEFAFEALEESLAKACEPTGDET